MMKVLYWLFPDIKYKKEMLAKFDELEVGILLCLTMDDTCNMSWKVYKEMEPFKEIKYFKVIYDKLWQLLEMQRESICNRKS